MGLLPSQSRWVRETVEAAGFPWSEFRLSYVPSMVVTGQYPVLRHEPTNATFGFDNVTYSTGWVVRFEPGQERPSMEVNLKSWDGVEGWFKNWLGIVRREIGAVEWWETIGRQPSITSAVSKEPFSPEEQSALAGQFDALKDELLQKYVPQEKFDELRAFVEQEFQDLKSMLKTMNKSSFRQSLLGYGLTIGGTIASNPKIITAVVRLFGEVIRPYTGGQPLLPEITSV